MQRVGNLLRTSFAPSIKTSTKAASSNAARTFACPSKPHLARMPRPARNTEPGPLETTIKTKLAERFQPSYLNIINDSHLHAGHAAMRAIGGGSGETHFTVEITSKEFDGKRAMQRHRLVYSTLQTELNSGLHALVIKAKTPKEAGEEEEPLAEDAAAVKEATAPPAAGESQAPAGP